MENKKRLLVFPLIAVLFFSMTACKEEKTAGTDTTDTAEENTVSDGKWNYEEGTVITLMIDNDMVDTGLIAVCDLAEKELGIIVEIEYRVGGSDGDNIVKTRLASGEMTDICAYNSGALLSALNPGEYFVDLTTNPEILDRLDDTYISAVTVDDKTFGIPVCATQSGAVMYNKDLYEEYNLETPNTWDEFIANCQVLKDAGENAVIGSFADSWTTQVIFLGDNANIMHLNPEFATDLANRL